MVMPLAMFAMTMMITMASLDESDAFPLDAGEIADSDSDGIGNNADTDDDNDGLLDTEEAALGTNPNFKRLR